MIYLKDILNEAKTGGYFYSNSTLSKLFIVKKYNEDHIYRLYRGNLNSLYLSIHDQGDRTDMNITLRFIGDHTYINFGGEEEFILIPNENAGSDEWFNFNIQNSSLRKTDFYPELTGLFDFLFGEYNRVFMKMLEDKGL